jgi:hypothetical protein
MSGVEQTILFLQRDQVIVDFEHWFFKIFFAACYLTNLLQKKKSVAFYFQLLFLLTRFFIKIIQKRIITFGFIIKVV